MTEENPWKTKSSRIVYENPWLTLREDQVVRPDGKDGIYSVIDTRIAVGIVALAANGEVCLIGQYRYPTKCYSWEIVEGGTDDNESPLETAKRELEEEAGFLAKLWTPLGEEVHISNCISSEVAVFYIAQELTEVEAKPDGTEVLQRKMVSMEDALKMVYSGEITDAMSIIALQRAERHLNGQ